MCCFCDVLHDVNVNKQNSGLDLDLVVLLPQMPEYVSFNLSVLFS